MHGLENFMSNSDEVDEYLSLIMAKSSQYKVGESERVIYQKMHSLKKINISMSALYNFNSQGMFPSIPIGLYGSTADQLLTKMSS